jgi:O-acetyl-ADP-ribose deacetylase (regulator of RNase III)
MIETINGNLLDAANEKLIEVIGHQTNNLGVMGGGVAAAIRNRWPDVYEKYHAACKKGISLGQCLIIVSSDNRVIANLMAQETIDRGVCNTDYKALRAACQDLVRKMRIIGFRTLAIPYKMGCGLGGGDWNIVLPILNEEFKDLYVVALKY